MIRKLLRYLAMEHGRAVGTYKRICSPNGREWAEYLRRHGNIYHLGSECSILYSTMIDDGPYTWIGDRVCLGHCALICHDGAIEVLNQRYDRRIDRVAPIIIKDDVFVGQGAVVLGGTTIGEGSIVGAGSVVRQSIPAGSVVMGNPAKVVGKVEDMLRFWEAESLDLPWADLIASRKGAYDPTMEEELIRRRQEHFFKVDPRRSIAPREGDAGTARADPVTTAT